MKTKNPNSNDIHSFKYSILISSYYNDIPNNPQRILNLNPCTHRYNLNHIAPKQFEQNNPNMSLSIFNADEEQICISNNNSSCQANIVKKNNRYAAIKPFKTSSYNLKSY